MTPRPVHKTMAETAADHLHNAIISGTIPPGTHLRLVDLSDRLGMSHMPVREALRRLETLGLVEVHPHRGAFVRELSRADLEDTMNTRILLERAAVTRAAVRFRPSDVEAAMAALDRYAALVDAELGVEAREAHKEVHFLVYRASESRWLLHALEPVWRNSERYRFASGHLSGSQLHSEHLPIIEACAANDPEAAGAALVRQLEGAFSRMIESVSHALEDRQGASSSG